MNEYTPWAGGDCPVASNDRVDLQILTSEGIVEALGQRARHHDWTRTVDMPGFGAIVGHRRSGP